MLVVVVVTGRPAEEQAPGDALLAGTEQEDAKLLAERWGGHHYHHGHRPHGGYYGI